MNRKSSGIAACMLLSLMLFDPHVAALTVPFTPGNIIVHNVPSGQDDLYEFTPDGVFVQQVPVVPRMGGQDLVIDRDGRVNINNSPTLNIYSPVTNSFSTRTFAGWSTVGNLTYGGIAAFDRYIIAADMNNSGSDVGMQGVVRFDLDGGPTTRFATNTDRSISI